MQVFLYGLAAILLLFLAVLLRAGFVLARMRAHEREALNQTTILSWPKVALIVPVCGEDPRIEPALRSLLAQDYPRFWPIFVTATNDEPAAGCIRRLAQAFPVIRHVCAGNADLCGQKNHNLLAGVSAASTIAPDAYVFCDSTHLAKPDFLQHLMLPIASGKAGIATGYHEIVPTTLDRTSLAYAASVLIMRLLQAQAVFTQPWGGAMAFSREVFERLGVRDLWQKTVVDDCALVPHLASHKCRVQLVASALLETPVDQYRKEVFTAWMERQILFPRFCVPLQWWLLGLMLFLFIMPPFIWIEDIWIHVSQGHFWGLVAPILWIGAFLGLVGCLRQFLPKPVGFWQWQRAFVCALLTFCTVYLGTIGSRGIVWHGKAYKVGKGGIVEEKRSV
ncbi:MAG: glycosyltransferase [Desulfovibrio sp.]|nr:glycosyltransferase [Desulfovibrio sp.]